MLASPRPLILGMLCRALHYPYQTKEVIFLIAMLPEFQDRRFVELLKKSGTLTCLIALAFSKMAATLVFVTDWTTGSFCFSLRWRLKDWTSTWVYEFRKLQTRNLVLTYL
jgi:hypothetical protein